MCEQIAVVPGRGICGSCMDVHGKPAEHAHDVAQREACLQCLKSSPTSDIHYAEKATEKLQDIYDRLEYLGGYKNIDDDVSKELEIILNQFDRVKSDCLEPLMRKLNEDY